MEPKKSSTWIGLTISLFGIAMIITGLAINKHILNEMDKITKGMIDTQDRFRETATMIPANRLAEQKDDDND